MKRVFGCIVVILLLCFIWSARYMQFNLVASDVKFKGIVVGSFIIGAFVAP